MKQNNSPWLTQLQLDREVKKLEQDASADVVIVGGGIAGVTTLYYLLKHTNKKIILLEGNKIAHGATGHNAGQVVAEFERPLASLVAEHGMHRAVDGYRMVESAWDLLDGIFDDTGIDIPFREFIGYGGYCELEQLLVDLETELIKSNHGLVSFPVLVSRESGWFARIPEPYRNLCTEVDARTIDELLGIKPNGYHAALPEKKATTNSALFSETLAVWCLENYPDRAQVFEHTFVQGIDLGDEVRLITDRATVRGAEAVLCTNGFENFYIKDKNGYAIDTEFHHLVEGSVGYMTGYLSHRELDPMANRYYENGKVRSADTFLSDPYFYVTRRKFGGDDDPAHLMAIGGPEVHLEDREIYFRDFDVHERFRDDAVAFAAKHFDHMDQFDQKFFWHGLMGYTRTGVRVVGREPIDPRLMYNLGCNGVGILPSIMGARKIARHVAGEPVPDTIFDPKKA